MLASAGYDHKIIVWNTSNAEQLAVLEGYHPDIIYSFSWNYNGSLLATTCKDKKIRVIDPRRNEVISVSICARVKEGEEKGEKDVKNGEGGKRSQRGRASEKAGKTEQMGEEREREKKGEEGGENAHTPHLLRTNRPLSQRAQYREGQGERRVFAACTP